MKKHVFIFFILCLLNEELLSAERTEKEIKIGVFKEDLETIGSFKKIEKAPSGLFKERDNSFHERQMYSLTQVGNIFVKQKGLLEKYPERMMRGMAYFEFFYQQELKDNERIIRRFNVNFPPKDNNTIKKMQKLYSLNKARKTMRNALGFSLEDDVQKVLIGYDTMFKLLEQSETSKNKLSKNEKKINKIHSEISKLIGKAKTLTEKRSENRILQKDFLKEYTKIEKKLTRALKKAEYKKEYELLSSFVVELHDYIDKISLKNNSPNSSLEIETVLSGYNVATFIMKDLKSNVLKKPFNQDLSKANFDVFSQEELIALGNITKNNKLKKIIAFKK